MTPRALAKLNSARLYRTGKPCCNGHTTYRYTKNGTCTGCEKAAYARNRADPKFVDKNRKVSLDFYYADPDRSKKRVYEWRAKKALSNEL